MCNADITPDVWSAPAQNISAQVQFGVLHTCRKFDVVQDWARENRSPSKLTDNDALPKEVLASWDDVVKAGLAYVPPEPANFE